MATAAATGERLARIETSLQHQEQKLNSIETKLDAFIENADAKYAHKEELADLKKVVYWVLGAAGGAIITVIFKFIFFP